MVVLTLFGKENNETVFFEEPLPKVHFAKLISCSLYTCWNTLKKEGTIAFRDPSNPKNRLVTRLGPGHYDLKRFAHEIESISKENGYGVEIEKEDYPRGFLFFKNPKKAFINIDPDLANLFTGGVREIFGTDGSKNKFLIQDIYYPTTYFVHCDLIDKEKNLFNGKKSSLLAKFDVKGNSYEKITYLSSPQEVFRECLTGEEVRSITISVRDSKGVYFDFKGLDMEFVLELN